jgi:hypothetical protein
MATITSGYSQDPGAGAGYDLPWEPHVFKITSIEVLNALSVGQIVTDITYTAGTPIQAGIGGNKILSLVYNTGNAGPLYLDNNGPFRTLMGVLIIDAAGTLLNPKVLLAGSGRGQITFKDLALSPNEKNKECFDKLVWNKQCEYSKDVLAYLNRILYGYISSPSKIEILKNKKRALEILNSYDTRDIANNTTTYNTLTYTEIKKLLNY